MLLPPVVEAIEPPARAAIKILPGWTRLFRARLRACAREFRNLGFDSTSLVVTNKLVAKGQQLHFQSSLLQRS